MEIAERSNTEPSLDRPPTQLVQVLSVQPELIGSVEKAVDELHQRLRTVLRSEDASGGIEKEKVPEGLVPLAQEIHLSNTRLSGLHTDIIYILDRLEL